MSSWRSSPSRDADRLRLMPVMCVHRDNRRCAQKNTFDAVLAGAAAEGVSPEIDMRALKDSVVLYPDKNMQRATGVDKGIRDANQTAQAIIDGGAKKVVSSASAKDDSQVVVMGANADEYDGSENFVSCASCTTNGLAPMVKAIHDKYDIQEALMTTVHAMTAT